MQINFLPYPQNIFTVQGLNCNFRISSNCFYSFNGGHWLPHNTLTPDPLTIGGQWRVYRTMEDWEKESYETVATGQPTLSRSLIFDNYAERLGNLFYVSYPYENTFGTAYKDFFDAMPEGVSKGIWQIEVIHE